MQILHCLLQNTINNVYGEQYCRQPLGGSNAQNSVLAALLRSQFMSHCHADMAGEFRNVSQSACIAIINSLSVQACVFASICQKVKC